MQTDARMKRFMGIYADLWGFMKIYGKLSGDINPSLDFKKINTVDSNPHKSP